MDRACHAIFFSARDLLSKRNWKHLELKENRLSEILAQYEEILESFSEEEKEMDTIKESKDGFVNAEVAKEAKQLKAGNEEKS